MVYEILACTSWPDVVMGSAILLFILAFVAIGAWMVTR